MRLTPRLMVGQLHAAQAAARRDREGATRLEGQKAAEDRAYDALVEKIADDRPGMRELFARPKAPALTFDLSLRSRWDFPERDLFPADVHLLTVTEALAFVRAHLEWTHRETHALTLAIQALARAILDALGRSPRAALASMVVGLVRAWRDATAPPMQSFVSLTVAARAPGAALNRGRPTV